MIELPRVQTTATAGRARRNASAAATAGGHVLGIERRWRAGARRAIGWPAARACATSHGCRRREVARHTTALPLALL